MLIEAAQFALKTGKNMSGCLQECIHRANMYKGEDILSESDRDEMLDPTVRDYVLNIIENDDYEVDNYEKFCKELYNGNFPEFLTKYTPEEFKKAGVHTYSVPGFEIGFALKPMGDDVDIISVHNNSGVKKIGGALIESAKRLGGTTLDHFDGFLSDFYKSHGFDEYDRWTWDDQYAPEGWNYDEFNRPDVVLRRLKKIK